MGGKFIFWITECLKVNQNNSDDTKTSRHMLEHVFRSSDIFLDGFVKLKFLISKVYPMKKKAEFISRDKLGKITKINGTNY